MWWSAALAWAGPTYDELKEQAIAARDALVWERELGADDVPVRAKEAFAVAVHDLLPAWEGTPWAMNGTTEVPGQGAVACGYFVATVLRDAGLPVQRISLAQRGAEDIIRTLTDESTIRRYWGATVDTVLGDHTDDGVYVVGLDWHVGLLVVTRGEATFCHASRSQQKRVLCEAAATTSSLRSRYTVVGELSQTTIDAWLSQDVLPTVTD